ncbi:MAG TPA: XdhC family protein [Syntrophorhabdaceae bacterium]|jgi:xanthine dehydrogenase accessory factor
MRELYIKIAELLSRGESFAVATIFDKAGSAPRAEGAKMVVRADGSIAGTIGGGRLEADAIGLAREVIDKKKTITHTFDLTSADAAGSDMICGGSGEILIDYIDAGEENNLKIYSEAARIVSQGRKGWLITVLDRQTGAEGVSREQCLIGEDRRVIGTVTCDPYLLEKLISGPAKITLHSEAFDTHRFLVEPLRQGGTVFLFGAGHVSQKIAPLSASVGFRTVVLDDREDFANRERFPEPTEIKVINSFKTLPDLGIGPDSYLVIVTRGHLFDKHVLEQVLRKGAAYVGMIGSRRKRDLIYEESMGRGFTKEELARVFSPIGTDIGAETPEELAVSIVGELIKVRSEKSGSGKKKRDSEVVFCGNIKQV